MKGSEHAQEKLKQREAEWDEAKQDWDAARRELQEARHRYSKKLLTDEDTSKLVRYLEMAQKQYEDAKMHYKEAKERYLIARDNSQQTSREGEGFLFSFIYGDGIFILHKALGALPAIFVPMLATMLQKVKQRALSHSSYTGSQ